MSDEQEIESRVIPHNTMRFDVHLAHIQPMIDDGDVNVAELSDAVRNAIIATIELVVGRGLDGRPIPGGAMILSEPETKMLHRETISFDLS